MGGRHTPTPGQAWSVPRVSQPATNMTHLIRNGPTLTLACRMPIRWDMEARAHLGAGPLSRTRVAPQIRQDIWRALQKLRGFAPLVEVTEVAGGYDLRAGGTVAARFPRAHTIAGILEVLRDRDRQARWVHSAAQGPVA